MEKIKYFLNPMARLGYPYYSILVPVVGTVIACILLETVAFSVQNQTVSGITVIFASIALVLYFTFRDGTKGGFVTIVILVAYYFYIVYTRQEMSQWESSFQTIFILTAAYLLIASLIGWLKQTLDLLIIKEKLSTQMAEEEKLRFKSIIQQLPVAVRVANIAENKVEGNKKLEQLLKRKINHSFAKEVEYMASRTYKNGKKFSVEDLSLLKAIKKGKKILSEEVEFIRDDKKRLFLSVSSTPIYNSKKQITSVVSTFYDVTPEREYQQRKDNFINMASHELKTPITSMNLYLDLLLKKVKKTNNSTLLTPLLNVRSQTQRLQELVSDLLDVSRIQTGKLRVKKQEFLLNELVREVCDLFQQTRKDKKIIIKNSKPIVVVADRFRIYQVLTNLLTNAIKYSHKGSEIIVREKVTNGSALISVQDFGIGIAEDERKKIFDLLYQANDTKERTFPGLGMGLYISKEIIKKHRGKIWADGKKGKGSTFYFTIPLK